MENFMENFWDKFVDNFGVNFRKMFGNILWYLHYLLKHYELILLILLEPVYSTKWQKKVPDQVLVCGIGDL